jgi:preprotein translocase subunit YajC
MNFLNIFLMTPASGDGQPGFGSFIPLLAVIVIFYFFMIRPQMKKQKEVRNFREGLKKGDKVLTVGGIYGKIIEVKETTAILEIADNVKIKVDKSGLVKDNADLGNQK